MKYFVLLLLLTSSLSAQDDAGISFIERPFAELLDQAKAEDKLIFIDAYTTWCGPCKMMVAQVFPDPEVGRVYNDRFINAKFDMEKGEGPGLASRYGVMAYPTYLFVNGDGDLVHQGLGFIPAPALLELADVAVSDRSLGALEARFESGDRSAELLRDYASALADTRNGERADRIVTEYLSEKDDWSDTTTLQLLLASPGEVGGERMNYLIANAKEADEKLGSDRVIPVIQQALVMAYHVRNRKRSLVEPDKIADFYKAEGGTLADRLLSSYALMYYERNRDMDRYLPAAVEHYANYPSDNYAELNGVAWTFFENTDDPELLALAIRWAEKSVELYPYYPNLDTLAWLYHKTGQQEKAKATALRAIEYAKEASLDFSETEKILQ